MKPATPASGRGSTPPTPPGWNTASRTWPARYVPTIPATSTTAAPPPWQPSAPPNTSSRCACGRHDCTAGPGTSPRNDVVIHVVADAAALAQAHASAGTAKASPATTTPAVCPAPAVVLGGGVIDTTVLAAFLHRATIREIRHPGHTAPEPRYQPSTALAAYVRARDLTCRFPGCDRPADRADLDHTIPYPAGPTSASNLKTLCRLHHLLKTFWTGEGGWRDEQLPDGTIHWTAPTGHTYTTHPGSALLFPTLCQPTTPVAATPAAPPEHTPNHRGHNMPRRRTTRAQNRTQRIHTERKHNTHLATEHTRPPPF
ncbi:HNH endonuclease [Mycolicibacterium sp. S2-37]|uniref:HNH endonuclease signature motif containing protein n=1 Tax=Mycolicibacterium sp. S2-37 TaxID=2810297 RepID=UPI001A93EAD6|nr:HNH endonuclease signature motif containing protein [Mycolicibacterium sp. S2-37]MBO0679589.1 HNH endonuclease [Mycolicibacterium sp. S2-37]